jgi:hypothetical protein
LHEEFKLSNSSLKLLALGVALLLPTALWAAEAAKKPIALVSAVGDQLTLVRQKEGIGSNIEPFTRRELQLNGQSLNFAMLRGLDKALELEEPQTPRVLLRWEAPEETRKALAESQGRERDDAVLQALISHLRSLPERGQWSRIEALLPKFFRHQARGMGTKLAGIGIYTQPLESGQIDLSGDGVATAIEGPADGHNRTINPTTGEYGRASTYVAPYVYFERVTLDAQTLAVIGRKSQFDNVKYHDPMATANDVFKHLPLNDLLGRLMDLAERSAYQSVRGKEGSVEVSTPRELPASAPKR